jgi:hypothetical protein
MLIAGTIRCRPRWRRKRIKVLELDDPGWSNLSHAYGNAAEIQSAPRTWSRDSGFGNDHDTLDIPSLLKQLESGDWIRTIGVEAEPWGSLWSALCHQGEVYSASYAAVPHIVRIGLSEEGILDWQFFGLPTCIEIGRADGRGPSIPETLTDSYFKALRQLHEMAYKIADQNWDEVLSQVIAAALVVGKGHPELSETILELSPEVIQEFRKFRGLE